MPHSWHLVRVCTVSSGLSAPVLVITVPQYMTYSVSVSRDGRSSSDCMDIIASDIQAFFGGFF